jgi:hypothetical protein
MYRFNNGEINVALALARRFARLAAGAGNPAGMRVADRLLGNTLHYAGDQREARRYFERVLETRGEPDEAPQGLLVTYDQRVLARMMLARVLWLQGFVEQAASVARASLAEARAIRHEPTECYVLAWAVCPIAMLTGDLATAGDSAARFGTLAAKYGVPLWQTLAGLLHGELLVRRGDFEQGTARLRGGLEGFLGSGWMLRPEFLAALAQGLAGQGRIGEALATISSTLAHCEADGQLWCSPELLRLNGQLLLRQGGESAKAEGEACLRDALDLAGRQGAPFWELRAALTLARLRDRQGRRGEARAVLEGVCARFTEGFDAPDFRAARALLAAWAG